MLSVLQVNYFVILRLYHRTLHGLEILMLPFCAYSSLSQNRGALLNAQPFKKLAALEPAIQQQSYRITAPYNEMYVKVFQNIILYMVGIPFGVEKCLDTFM